MFRVWDEVLMGVSGEDIPSWNRQMLLTARADSTADRGVDRGPDQHHASTEDSRAPPDLALFPTTASHYSQTHALH